MRRDSADAAPLWDMQDATRRLQRLVDGVDLTRFESDEAMRLACERLLQIIGEAARRVSPGYRRRHRDVPWIQLIGQRHILVHEYGEIASGLVWLTVTRDIPKLATQLEALVPATDARGG